MVLGDALEKRYGRKRVLRGVTFAVPRGGFLVVTGANGAGKTTLLRLVAGLAAPTRGVLEVEGDRRDLGFVGHEPLVYRELTALENLELFGRLYRVADRRERSGMLLERFGLWDARSDRVSTYSRGMVAAPRALSRASCTIRRCSCSTSRSRRSTRKVQPCSTPSSPRSRASGQ